MPRGCLGFVLASLLLALPVYSQESRASLSGTVTDPQGAVVPNAKIDVKNLDTNVVTAVQSNDRGLYNVPPLNPGRYSVTVTATGFKTLVRSNVELRVADRVALDLRLDVGGSTETITVTAETPLLETASSSQGTVISKESVAELPLLGRNAFTLAGYTAGTVRATGARSGSDRPFDNGGMDSYNVNGSSGSVNEFLLDGAPNTSRETTSATNLTFVPPPDAVGEFKMQTNNYDAEFGRTGGGVISVSLKSGTNDVHGSAYWYFRNDKLNANSYQTNRIPLADPTAKAGRAAFRWAQPGAQIQGPVVIPKIYDGRNKTFFMYSLEIIRSSVPRPSSLVMPTALERTGDFSKTYVSGTSGASVAIYDPLTTIQTGTSTYVRTPFSGSLIPTSRINPIAKTLMGYYPAPNLSGINRGQPNLVSTPNATTDKYNAHTFRLDQSLTTNNRFFATITRGNRHEDGGLGGGRAEWIAMGHPEAAPTYTHWRINHGATFNLTSLLSATTVSTFRAAFNRHEFAIVPYSNGFDPTALGFPSSLVSQVQNNSFPTISPGGYQALAGGYGGSALDNFSSTWSFGETVTKTVSKHSIKLGVEWRNMLNNQGSLPPFAALSSSAGFTQANPLVSASSSGDGLASMLLGYLSSGSNNWVNTPAQGQHYYVAFFQDDWRVSDKLTINVGLRWDYESPLTDRYNRFNSGFDKTTKTTLPGTNIQVTGGLLFASADNRSGYKKDMNNFQPRIGFAYKVGNKGVIRGGWGISFLPTADVPPTAGFATSTPTVTSNDGNLTPALLPNGLGKLSNPFPEGINTPAGSSLGLRTFLGQSVSYIYPDRVIPYVHSVSMGYQHELPWRTVIDLSYVGSRTRALQTSKQINDVGYAEYLQYGSTLGTTQVANPYAGLLTGTTLNSATYSLQQSLRPFPQFTGVTESGRSIGTTRFDSMQVRAEKRISNGLQVLFTYTLSHNTNHNSYLNGSYDAFGQFITQISGDDRPHVANITATYAIPLAAHSSGIKKAVFGGWQMSGIFVYMSAGLFNVGAGSAVSTGLDPSLGSAATRAHWFNTCTLNRNTNTRQNCTSASEPVAWIINPPATLVTQPNPQFLRFDRPWNIDFSMFKSFTIWERVKMEFRAESFNLTNTPMFGNPNTTPTSSSFGVVTESQSNDPRNLQLALRLSF
jgi:hypothetical protein